MNGEHQYSSFFTIFALYISAESPRVGKDMCIIYGEDVYKRLAFGFQNFAPFDLSKEQMATGNVLVVCIFTYCPSLFGKGHAVYISAWAFCVARSWQVGMRRPWNSERAKVRFLRLFYIQAVLMLDLTCPLGVRMNKEGYAAYRTAYSLHASRARAYGDMVCKTVVLHTA